MQVSSPNPSADETATTGLLTDSASGSDKMLPPLSPISSTSVLLGDESGAAATTSENPVEHQFRAAQLMTACFMALAHGANDVSNAAGPLAGIWNTYTTGVVATAHTNSVMWIVALSCVGAIVGLMFFGERVIATIGSKLVHMSPSRGYSVELGTALTVLVASFLGIPISSTHCVVGAVISVGIVDARGLNGVQWSPVYRILLSWLLTLPLAGGISAILFASLRPLLAGSAPPVPGAVLMYCIANCSLASP
jgi:phosphate/sulfate permease